MSLAGVEDFAPRFSFLSLYEGVESYSFCSADKESQCIQAAGGVSTQGSEPFFLSRQRAHTECWSKPAIMWPQPPRRWLGEDIMVYDM